MDSEVLKEICNLHRNGARVLMQSNHLGNHKVKVVYGFLGLRVKRYQVDTETLEAIKNGIGRSRSRNSSRENS